MRRLLGRVAVLLSSLILISILIVLNFPFFILNEKQTDTSKDHNDPKYTYRSSKSMVPEHNKTSDVAADLNVYIVEEHHAVLKYWFDAARSGSMERQGNILIHIDGHSDLAMPLKTDFFPAFRFPKTPFDLEAMMQSNDVFILGAAMSGLFKKIIWIWPSWDKPSHDEMDDITLYKLGVTTLIDGDPDDIGKTFCMCYTNISTSQEMCAYTPVNVQRDEMIDIPYTACDIHSEINVIYTEETVGFETLIAEEVNNDNIVLDIDEDFYGCTLPAQDLVDVQVTVKETNEINEMLGIMFCPVNVEQEISTDKMLYSALEMLKSDEACTKVVAFSKCSGYDRREIALHYLEQKSIDLEIRCHFENTDFEPVLQKFVSRLSLMNAAQLTVLQNVGFCISTMLPSITNLWESTFGVCIGINVPGDTMVLDHKTNLTEIQYRTGILKDLMKSLKTTNIRITTVCRSVRDGYTPRKYFRHIEKDVLETLSNLERHTFLNYDPWLLGGKSGWYNRHNNL